MSSLVISGVSRLDINILDKKFGKEKFVIKRRNATPSEFNQIPSIELLFEFSPEMLNLILLWLLVRKNKEKITIMISEKDKDGNEKRMELKGVRESDSENSRALVDYCLKQIEDFKNGI